MRLFLKIGVGLICLLAVVAGIFWVWATEPNRKIDRNPIMSEVSKANQIWETRVDLIGTVFVAHQSKSDFETYVEKAGFSKDSEFKFYKREDSVSPNELVWSARQGSLVCDMEWAVIAEFNESNLLMSADGIVSERGCL
jgi:hypothetical protein